jgi:TRAP-type mannitol/chloroaromatic compound transport system permease small subunit
MGSVELPQTRLSKIIDPVIILIGQAASYLWLVLLLVIVVNVVLRYIFGEGHIEFEELQWHLYSLGFLLGLCYALQTDAHIRVDVLHEHLRPRLQAWLELYGLILCLFPFIALILIYGVPFVITSFELGEVSQSPGGLPYRWVIKAAIPLGFGLLLVAAISRLSRVWAYLFGSHHEPG